MRHMIEISEEDVISEEEAANHLDLVAFGCANELEVLVERLEKITDSVSLIPKNTVLDILAPAKEALKAREEATISLVCAQVGRVFNRYRLH